MWYRQALEAPDFEMRTESKEKWGDERKFEVILDTF